MNDRIWDPVQFFKRLVAITHRNEKEQKQTQTRCYLPRSIGRGTFLLSAILRSKGVGLSEATAMKGATTCNNQKLSCSQNPRSVEDSYHGPNDET